jgi:hypothetical protein
LPRFVAARCEAAARLPRVQPSQTLNPKRQDTMNRTDLAPRLYSFVLAALLTATTLAGIDTLAYTEHAANGLMAQATAQAGRPA